MGFHTEMGERVLADIQKELGLAKLDIKYQPVTSQNRIPLVINDVTHIVQSRTVLEHRHVLGLSSTSARFR